MRDYNKEFDPIIALAGITLIAILLFILIYLLMQPSVYEFFFYGWKLK